jgi:hypothetical protein
MMTLSIAYEEIVGSKAPGLSPKEDIEYGVSTATRIIDVAWTSRALAVQQVLGYPTVNAGVLSRELPERHPEFPFLTASKVSCEGVGKPDGSQFAVNGSGQKYPLYTKCRMTISYTMRPYAILPNEAVQFEWQRFTELTVKPAGELFQYPMSTLKWGEGPGTNTPIGSSVSVPVSFFDLVFKWYQIPFASIPFDAIGDTLGRVNKTTLRGFTPHQLLLTSCEIENQYSPYGDLVCNISYMMRANVNLNTKLLRWQDLQYYFAKRSTDNSGGVITPGNVPDGLLIYDERDFNDIFTVV